MSREKLSRQIQVGKEQGDQIGRFRKFLARNIVTKVVKILCGFWGYYENATYHVNTAEFTYFLGNFWKHLGYFLLQHLVALAAPKQCK